MSPEAGGATVLLAAVVTVIATVGIATAGLGLLLTGREKAATAAEAAALSAAVATYPPAASDDPRAAAGEIAARNGARLIGCACPVQPDMRVRTVTVVVAFPMDVPIFGEVSVQGAARAEFDPQGWLGV